MGRIENSFDHLRAQGRKALIPFITAGDPQPQVTPALMHRLVEAGADMLELGVPFSDPMADGPVIQQASERALVNHVSLHDVLDMVRSFRQRNTDTPVILMGYLNPIEVMGYQAFASGAAEAGVDGVLTVDMPPEEAGELEQAMTACGLAPIFLLSPTTTGERMDIIASQARGFLYYVSLKGVTGSARLDVDEVAGKLDVIRRHTDLPLGVGFGIHDANTAARVARVADAVIIGSALVARIGELQQRPAEIPDAAYDFVKQLRTAMDAT